MIFLNPFLLVGKNGHGQWVVRSQRGSRGGLFVDRSHALKFAMFETGRRPQAVIMVPGILELDMSGKPSPATIMESNLVPAPLKQAA
jgi:hypothetical protein